MRSFSRELPLQAGGGTTGLFFSFCQQLSGFDEPCYHNRCGDYLEGAWLEAGLADGDSTLLGEEYGEREGPSEERKLLLFCDGDLGQQGRGGRVT